MKAITLSVFLILIGMQYSFAQNDPASREIIKLSKDKWQWMADKNVAVLDSLFDEQSMFVHTGGSWENSGNLKQLKAAVSGIGKQRFMMCL